MSAPKNLRLRTYRVNSRNGYYAVDECFPEGGITRNVEAGLTRKAATKLAQECGLAVYYFCKDNNIPYPESNEAIL